MDSGGMPDDWTPPPPPDIGSKRWLDEMAFAFMVESFQGLPDRSCVYKLPRVRAGGVSYELGYFVVLHRGTGKDYFRVNQIENVPVRPKFEDDATALSGSADPHAAQMLDSLELEKERE